MKSFISNLPWKAISNSFFRRMQHAHSARLLIFQKKYSNPSTVLYINFLFKTMSSNGLLS